MNNREGMKEVMGCEGKALPVKGRASAKKLRPEYA